MIVRILVWTGLVALGAGFIFFAGNVIWLGTKEFFKVYGTKAKPKKLQLLKEDNTNNTNNTNK